MAVKASAVAVEASPLAVDASATPVQASPMAGSQDWHHQWLGINSGC